MPTAFIQRLDVHPTTTYVLPRSSTAKPLTITQPWPSGPIPKGTTNTKQYFIDAPPYSVFNYTSFAPGSNNIHTFGQANLALNKINVTSDLSAVQVGSAFFQPKLDIYKSFTTGFNLQFTSPTAEGATFVIQNSASNALGDGGEGLGYSNILDSIAIRFDTSYLDRDSTLVTGVFSTDILTGGSVPTGVAGSGDINRILDLYPSDTTWNLDVSVSYDGTSLSYTIANAISQGFSFTSNATYNIPTTIGSSNAWIGFTGSTDTLYSQACSISAWNWSNSK